MTVAALASIMFNRFDQIVLSSGVYRYGSLPDPNGRHIIFYRDGRTATVAVGRSLPDSFTWIATNGKPDASVDRAWFSARDTTKLPRAERRHLDAGAHSRDHARAHAAGEARRDHRRGIGDDLALSARQLDARSRP